jgi:hypothetical protein
VDVGVDGAVEQLYLVLASVARQVAVVASIIKRLVPM